MSNDKRSARIVVTGVGMVTPLGPDRETSWRGLVDGRRAVRRLTADDFCDRGLALDASAGDCFQDFRSKDFCCRDFAGAPCRLDVDVRGQTAATAGPLRVIDFAVRAAREAFDDAGSLHGSYRPDRMGCVIGTSKGAIGAMSALSQIARGGPSRRAPSMFDEVEDWTLCFPDGAARAVAGVLNLGGPRLCPVAACATGLTAIARGAELVRDGECDVVLAGASDASLEPAVLASFRRLGVLARFGNEPASACRPFHANRSGFAVGEGAAVVVLERLNNAIARKAKIYGEWLEAVGVSDPAGMAQLSPDAAGLEYAIRTALARAGVEPAKVDYVNLHGTATRANDLCETRAVKGALGASARNVSCSGLKGALGHLLGAAGAVETAATFLALRDGVVPPTVNLDEPDPELDLDYTPNLAVRRPIDCALKLSLGFGGHVAVGVCGRLDARGGQTRRTNALRP